MRDATAQAHANIALVKYWGKRDAALNVPATGSLSLTLGALTTTTTVRAVDAGEDRIVIPEGGTGRVARFLDLVRDLAGSTQRVEVRSANDFPTAAGLASSASGFAALALAATRAFDVELDERELTRLARRGSGSAARSIPGGWVEMVARADDAWACAMAGPEHWDLRCVVLVTAQGTKKLGSTDAMELTARTSPFYPAWVDGVPSDVEAGREAVLARDFERLATVSERSCLRMHACAMAADPGILYWNARTVELIGRVRAGRVAGIPMFFTIDAGPHVKVFCPPQAVADVEELARDVSERVIVSAPGGPARLIERSDD